MSPIFILFVLIIFIKLIFSPKNRLDLGFKQIVKKKEQKDSF